MSTITHPEEEVLYTSPYLVATPKGYTKHYYAENERIASRIGGGRLAYINHPIVHDEEILQIQKETNGMFKKVVQGCLDIQYYEVKPALSDLYRWEDSLNPK